MESKQLLERALKKEFLSAEEGQFLYENVPTADLMWTANELRQIQVPGNVVTWQIDRNVNTTNACTANCKFCNFFRHPKHKEVYITNMQTYKVKIEETIKYGGDQLLLQGGHHPDLSDRVRRLISKGKCTGQEWLDVMKVAHKVGLTTSATMMFGHIETIEERFDHLVRIREVQAQKPEGENGFLAFIPWPFMDDGTLLQRVKGINNNTSADEYMRMIAICRIMLPNIKNIQTSWLTVGADTAQLTLHGGANDMGSIMIEENVVSAAGAPHRFTANSIQECIKEAGFEPQLRTQLYTEREMPEMEQQVIDY